MNWQEEFPNVSPKQWKQKIQFELAGLDYNETLISDIEGIQVKPFYTFDDVKNTSIDSIKNKKKSGWIKLTSNPKFANFADALWTHNLKNQTQNVPFYFEPNDSFDLEFLHQKNITNLAFDLFGFLEKNGKWLHSKKEDSFNFIDTLLSDSTLKNCLLADASLYQNAGANMVEQIAFVLLKINEYLHFFGKESVEKMVVKVAVGSNYFFEIAKLRSLRYLWRLILNEYEIKDLDLFLVCESTHRNKTIADKENNLIRSSLESSASIKGSANALLLHPYDLENQSEFAEELAIKQQLLLQNESYFETYGDTISGAYFVEYLVNQMSEKALNLFKEFEVNGGFLENLYNHSIQKRIEKSNKKEIESYKNGSQTLVGVNKFQNSIVSKMRKHNSLKGKRVLFPTITSVRVEEALWG